MARAAQQQRSDATRDQTAGRTGRQAVNTTYTVYRADGAIKLGAIDWPESPPLPDIRALVEPLVGGPLKHVRVLDPARAKANKVSRNNYRNMFVNEDGHIRTVAKARNHAATAIYRGNWLRAEGSDPEDLPWIAGNTVTIQPDHTGDDGANGYPVLVAGGLHQLPATRRRSPVPARN